MFESSDLTFGGMDFGVDSVIPFLSWKSTRLIVQSTKIRLFFFDEWVLSYDGWLVALPINTAVM